MTARPRLRVLADRLGILSSYEDQSGVTQFTTDAARVALLDAMGVDASSEAAAARALTALDERAQIQAIPAAQVVRENTAVSMDLSLPGSAGAETIRWEIELRTEDGTVHERSGTRRISGASPRLRVHLPADLPRGYHTVRLALRAGGERRECVQLRIVTPPRCPTPAEVLGGVRVYGLLANLYTVRSKRNWGSGDLGDLRRLVRLAADGGAAFVGLNPLHALHNRGGDISPYSPISRLFRNPLYIDVEAVPEFSEAPAAQPNAALLRRLRAADRIDYDGVSSAKLRALRTLHRRFLERHEKGATARGRAYRRYVEREDGALRDFATFMALHHHDAKSHSPRGWRSWPRPLRDPSSAAVEAFRRSHRREVSFWCYLQFEIDRQLGRAAAATRGMPVGLYQDLAIGSSPDGSDTWAFPDLFLDGARVGAPPDDYSAGGQDWGLPAIDPRRLRDDGYRYWSRLVRAALRHAGALRIDHVLGLFRQYWIPRGLSPVHGAYVRFPTEDLLGVLALETGRAGALAVGEDLGTVPGQLPPILERWKVLSTRVLYFERGARGSFRGSQRYPERALVSANTHDMAPLAGYRRGRDIAIRHQVGLISGAEARTAETARERERAALLRRLRSEGVLPPGRAAVDDAAFADAVHAFLCRTPAAMVALSLDDVAGEIEPVNVPGVAGDRYPSWSRRMARSLEDLGNSGAIAGALRRAARSGGRRPVARRRRTG